MIRISAHGNSKKKRGRRIVNSLTGDPLTGGYSTSGFILLDALLCIFVAGILVMVIYGASSLHRRANAASSRNTGNIIEERNRFERQRMNGHE